MELDYKNITGLVDIRMKQIDEASRTHEYFNKEYISLMKIRNQLTELNLLERKNWTDFEVVECIQEVEA